MQREWLANGGGAWSKHAQQAGLFMGDDAEFQWWTTSDAYTLSLFVQRQHELAHRCRPEYL